ncbi:hypothetical protein Goshw_003962 [Gossypium schwendimanii]|uniref:RNase H type-1 domain-containing protein n=1 Tax=Gossypium schwendimanii TaxID=34291 RepID=A0A7J9LKJ3_GOSSC|nr:hypothetical protein [Gossypium schwendimanii]
MILQTNAKVATIQQNVDRGYPRCGVEVEIVIHAFMDVPNPVPFSLAACSATGSSMVTALKWEKPPNDFVKVKVDAGCRNNTMSYGIIIRDCDGLIIVGKAGVKDVQIKLEWAELYALSEEVLIARDLNPGNVIFET